MKVKVVLSDGRSGVFEMPDEFSKEQVLLEIEKQVPEEVTVSSVERLSQTQPMEYDEARARTAAMFGAPPSEETGSSTSMGSTSRATDEQVDRDIQEERAAEYQAANVPYEVPGGLYRYRFQVKGGEPVIKEFDKKLSDAELLKYMDSPEGEGLEAPRIVQSSFESVVGESPGIGKTFAATLFPRLAEMSMKGELEGEPFKGAAAGTMDVASIPFRSVMGVADEMLGDDDPVPSGFYTGGIKEGEQRGGVSEFVQETGRAPENILSFGGGPAVKAVPLSEMVTAQGAKRAFAEGAGNIAGEVARAEVEDREFSPMAAMVGGVLPTVFQKAGRPVQEAAFRGAEKRLKFKPTDQGKRFSPEVENLFKHDLITWTGGAEGIYNELSGRLSQLGRKRAEIAGEMSEQARLKGAGKTAEELREAELFTVELSELQSKAVEEVDRLRAKGKLTKQEAGSIKGVIQAEIDDLSELAVFGITPSMERLNNLVMGIDAGRYVDDTGKWNDVGLNAAEDAIGIPADELQRLNPAQLVEVINQTGGIEGFAEFMASENLMKKSALPVEQFLGRRSMWFEKGNVNDPRSLQDLTRAERMGTGMLWESSSPYAYSFDEIAPLSAEMRDLVALEKALGGRLPALQNKWLMPGLGSVPVEAMRQGRNLLVSNPALKAEYGLGKMLQEPGMFSIREPLTEAGVEMMDLRNMIPEEKR